MSEFPVYQTTAATIAQTRFSLDMVRQLAFAAGPKNVAISPLGILAALALAMGAAGGTTKTAFGQLLFNSDELSADAQTAFANWLKQLLAPGPAELEEGNAVLTLATSLWADYRFAISPAFTKFAQVNYDAQAKALDLTSSKSASVINKWVQQQTKGRIDTIISAADLAGSPPPEILLLNAVYFRARWQAEFDPVDSRPGQFRCANGTTQPVTLMNKNSAGIAYLSGSGWQAISLPYESHSRSISMEVFLPDTPNGLPAFMATLNAENWASWTTAWITSWTTAWATAEEVVVDLSLPRFRIEWSDDLVPVLNQSGLADAFEPGADFSGLGFQAESGGGFIGSILHKTYLAVDEQGTEAAAVTAMMWMAGGASEQRTLRQVSVKVDSPFFYAITDQQSGALLFAGTVNELTDPLS